MLVDQLEYLKVLNWISQERQGGGREVRLKFSVWDDDGQCWKYKIRDVNENKGEKEKTHLGLSIRINVRKLIRQD